MRSREELLSVYHRPSEATCALAGIDPALHETRFLMNSMGMHFVRESRVGGDGFPRIEISAAGMRVGKTTAEGVLEERLARGNGYPVEFIWEEWQKNPHLSKSYQGDDPVRRSEAVLQSQLWFLHHKYGQVSRPNGHAVHVQEVPPEMDYNYALTNFLTGKLLPEHFERYRQAFYSLDWSRAYQPDLLVHLDVSEEQLISRVRLSLRDFEQADIDEQYYRTMRAVNTVWIEQAMQRGWNVLVVNTDELNFAEREEHKEIFTNMVADALANIH